MYRYLFLFVETIALIICLLCYRKFNLTRYKLFLPYLAIIILYEIGSINKLLAINKSNLWIVNFEVLFEFLFFSFFIISAYRDRKEKKIFGAIALLTFFFTLIDIFFIQGVMRLCSIAIVLQYALLIVMVCRFFYKLMQHFEKDNSLLKQPDFWVNTGCLFFFLVGFMTFASFNLAYARPHFFRVIFDIINGVANIILYSCLIISFICYKPTRTISSS